MKTAFVAPVPALLAFALLTGCAPPAQTAAGALPPAAPPAQNLIGATPAILSAEFGQPALLRVDGPAQVWLYHAAACGLNLILYPDSAGIPRVAMVTATDGSPDPGTCSASLQQAHIEAALEHPASS